MRSTTFLFVSLLWLVVAAPAAQAEVVRCTDADGRIVYTDGACPPGTRQSRQLRIDEPPPAPPRASSEEDTPRRSDYAAPTAPPPQPAPSGPAIIPRYPVGEAPAADPGPTYIWGGDPYYGPPRPGYHPRPPRPPRDPGPPPGQRPCNLAGIKRSNC